MKLDTDAMIAEMHADWKRVVKEHDEHHAALFGNGKRGLKGDMQAVKRDLCGLKWISGACLVAALGLIARLILCLLTD